jgi:thioredoxin 2
MNSEETKIVQCGHCGAKNRVSASRPAAEARCGKCGTSLSPADGGPVYKLRCTGCGAKNRVKAGRLAEGAKCGRCSSALDTDALFAPQPMMVTDVNFDEKVLQSPLPVLLYAMSPTCPGCAQVGPVVDRFAADTKQQVRVAKLNINSSPRTANRLNVMGVPFLFVYDNGSLKESMPGVGDLNELKMRLGRYL